MRPLDLYEELVNWVCPNDMSECCTLNFSERKLQECSGLPINSTAISRRNKVLCCHDMKGGYLDDTFIDGNNNIYAYRFYHWHLIDIFIYFSHHFITIPPTGWIHQAHKNGVQCLGTLIIEPGNHIDNFLKVFNSNIIHVVAGKLTEIRKFYNFDGWLINIECSVEGSLVHPVIQNICEFLNCLSKDGNEVIWYDAITEHGCLAWRNCLDDKNRIFYDNCGKIFTNYCWNEDNLKTSLMESPNQSNNVFIGIDCFGRGCPGGGGYNCDYALKMIDEAFHRSNWKNGPKLSIALFAQAWCYEQIETEEENRNIDLNVWRFFDRMNPYLHSFLDGRIIYRQLPEISIDKGTCFQTNFDIGQGSMVHCDGEPLYEIPYNNLMDQQVTPSGSVRMATEDIAIKIIPCRDFSYTGYSCMRMVVDIGNTCLGIVSPISVEIFRLGCHLQRDSDAVLHLLLGQISHVTNNQIWTDLCLKLSFSMSNVGIQTLECKLEDIIQRDFVGKNPSINWYYFRIDKLCTRFTESDVITLRKVELIINNIEVLRHLSLSSLYFGSFKIEAMN